MFSFVKKKNKLPKHQRNDHQMAMTNQFRPMVRAWSLSLVRVTTRPLLTTAHQRNGHQMAMTNQITTVTQNRVMDRRTRHETRARDV